MQLSLLVLAFKEIMKYLILAILPFYLYANELEVVKNARISFENKDFIKAEELYKSIKNTSELWPRTLLERAWANYYLKNYNKSLGLLATLKFPMLRRYSKVEGTYLEALIYYQLCLFGDSHKTIDEFLNKDDSIYEEATKDFKKNLLRSQNLLIKSWISGIERTSVIQNKVYSDKEMIQLVQFNLTEYERFKEFMEIMKLEILSHARKQIYEQKTEIQKRTRGNLNNLNKTKSQMFWEFKEEFWADELGGFVFALESKC